MTWLLSPFALLLVGLALLGLSGCSLLQPPPVDFAPMAAALKFVGVCSVLCSLIWGSSIVAAAKHHQNKPSNANPPPLDPDRSGGVRPRGGDRAPVADDDSRKHDGN